MSEYEFRKAKNLEVHFSWEEINCSIEKCNCLLQKCNCQKKSWSEKMTVIRFSAVCKKKHTDDLITVSRWVKSILANGWDLQIFSSWWATPASALAKQFEFELKPDSFSICCVFFESCYLTSNALLITERIILLKCYFRLAVLILKTLAVKLCTKSFKETQILW